MFHQDDFFNKGSYFTGPTTANEQYGTAYSYDKHGNMLTLLREGKTDTGYGVVDRLAMSYEGNKLTGVSDEGVSVTLPASNVFEKGSTATLQYGYNLNGAMTKDLNKKISDISYNVLNLPNKVEINGTTHRYRYAADGRKLQVRQGNSFRDYVGNVIYEDGSLTRILVDGGYVQREGSEYKYYFYLSDHLGNNSVVANQEGEPVQNNSYYPFGLPMAETADSEQEIQPYKYNGKEFERKDGLNLFDYGARHMDPALGRFTTVDPMAEKYYAMSPYAYVANNPLKYIDIWGLTKFLAIAMGKDVKYRGEMISRNDPDVEAYSINNGINDFISVLKTATDQDSEGVGFLSVWSHGSAGYAYPRIFDKDRRDSNKINTKDLALLEEAIKNGEIVFAKNAVIYIGGCNMGWGENKSFAQQLANITVATVIAADESVSPVEENESNMIYTTTYPRKSQFYEFSSNKKQNGMGARVNTIQLLNRTKRMTQPLPVMDMQPQKGMNWEEFYNFLNNAINVNPNIKVTYQ